jgi:hypothetical protein
MPAVLCKLPWSSCRYACWAFAQATAATSILQYFTFFWTLWNIPSLEVARTPFPEDPFRSGKIPLALPSHPIGGYPRPHPISPNRIRSLTHSARWDDPVDRVAALAQVLIPARIFRCSRAFEEIVSVVGLIAEHPPYPRRCRCYWDQGREPERVDARKVVGQERANQGSFHDLRRNQPNPRLGGHR